MIVYVNPNTLENDIESFDNMLIKVKRDSWAPGIWAGTEGATFYWKPNNIEQIVEIASIDYEKRTITIKVIKS